ncbi:MAG TPA: MBL fold metallo-hydrolase [Actinomycetes bacterium]|nr:MBL fold metallo-hydrolase [Actinomycetes bacterium]
MSYTGDVTVGGPAQVRELPALIITKVAVGPYENNCYLLRCRSTGQQLLIDAADSPDVLIDLAGSDGLAAVVTTHSHGDHWQALPAVVDATGAQTIAHPLDAPDLPVTIDRLVEAGERVEVGSVSLEVIHLRGHTPGGIALLYDDPEGPPHLFTGDSLFPGGPGRTTSPDDFDSLMGDLQAKVFDRLPDETWFYPGHGKDSTLGAERPHLPEWRARGW